MRWWMLLIGFWAAATSVYFYYTPRLQAKRQLETDFGPKAAELVSREGAYNEVVVLLKPHVVEDSSRIVVLVRQKLLKAGLSITAAGSVFPTVRTKLNQHHGALALFANHRRKQSDTNERRTTVVDLMGNVSEEIQALFHQVFEERWRDVVESGRVFSANEVLGLVQPPMTARSLFFRSVAAKKDDAKSERQVVVTSNCVVSQLRLDEGERLSENVKDSATKTVYVLNAQYPYLLDSFLLALDEKKPGRVDWILARWPARGSPNWNTFRETIIGNEDPSRAVAGSIRGDCFTKWKEFGLTKQPSRRENCIHASTNTLDAYVERLLWVNESKSERRMSPCQQQRQMTRSADDENARARVPPASLPVVIEEALAKANVPMDSGTVSELLAKLPRRPMLRSRLAKLVDGLDVRESAAVLAKELAHHSIEESDWGEIKNQA